ncbi:MAG TPA: molybdopterin molybdenumtransferase MoeA [Methanomicrobia archaeon]|nr:molybdopterin molybdenumtransferase MoeA [Methanomicrobia archaeon]
MKLFRTLISYDEALQVVVAHAHRMGAEIIRFDEALNRVLAEDVRSPVDSPPFDRAAMDGYAVRGEDSFGATPRTPVTLKLIRSSSEGESGPQVALRTGECAPIATGMPIPEGSNAVVMLEYTKERGDMVDIYKPVTPGKNVSARGEDVKKGEIVLKAGKRFRPHDIGLLASLRLTTVQVCRKARIGILSTGDELANPAELNDLKLKKIADANSYVLTALTQSIASPYRIGIVRDDYTAILNSIRQSLDGTCDVLLVTGGSSVGSRDYVADAVEELGELLFHGVAIRPGEPVGFGLIKSKPIYILPGYPVATIAAFELLVRPFLYALHGLADERRIIGATARKKIPSTVGRTDFVRVRVLRDGDDYAVEPVRVSGSGILSSMTKSNGFAVIAANKEGVEEGDRVAVTCYNDL